MGALPWTLRTSTQVMDKTNQQDLKVNTSESSPLPKSVTTAHDLQAKHSEHRRGSADNIQKYAHNTLNSINKTGLSVSSNTNREDNNNNIM